MKKFEKSKKDMESMFMGKEGSKKEEGADMKQMHKRKGMKCGGAVKMAAGGSVRGTGCATKGKNFSGLK